MQTLIETPNLGSVTISKMVINFFIKQRDDGDVLAATNEVTEILQSQEIDQLVTPIPSPGLEFWVHRSSSLVFTALPKDGYRLVSMVLKGDMSDFVFDTE
ncbi:hypothetical protein [Marinobacterium sp. xm-a-152]|jgi:hypothetical protein|uniref:hypothetical protein n=1 Tax=Marinobacterium sp. xm-a-152 TaxID=2497733 RepID=UPI001569CE44|nr:hypothetical protein [Marinobacterium sp. xm-a-152]NRP16720.1 hypothetical protein [Marinobacterium sp. xm-a-152]